MPNMSNFVDAPFQFPTHTQARVLAENTAEVIDVPLDPATGKPARFVKFGRGDEENFYSRAFKDGETTTITIPAADETAGNAPEKNPEGFALFGNCTKISVISPAAMVLTVSFYK
jgi:hypothetical protein